MADNTSAVAKVRRARFESKVLELMAFPDVPQQPEPKRISVERRDGYQLQRWEAYPEPYCVVPFLMLVPDGVSAQVHVPIHGRHFQSL